MRWYINDSSLQGQFGDTSHFLAFLEGLLKCRYRFANAREGMHLSRLIADRPVVLEKTLRQIVSETSQTELRRAILSWLDKNGPFIENDRQPEVDDYFECKGLDVTDAGLGESARRVMTYARVSAISFSGGAIDFGESPLHVDHGLLEDRLGKYSIENFWSIAELEESLVETRSAPINWRELVEAARELYPRLWIPDAVYINPLLSKEPFETAICERVMVLLKHLDAYMANRLPTGAEAPAARTIIENFFTGERALFSGESTTNQHDFKSEMTFIDPENDEKTIFSHWHGKISRRYFRLHIEWPVPPQATKLKILYLGPKLTKS